MLDLTLLRAAAAGVYTHLTYFLFLHDLLHVLYSETLGMTSLSSMTLTFNLPGQFNSKITPNPPWHLELGGGGSSRVTYPGTKAGHRVQPERIEKDK